jgi:hypothetical protein
MLQLLFLARGQSSGLTAAVREANKNPGPHRGPGRESRVIKVSLRDG